MFKLFKKKKKEKIIIEVSNIEEISASEDPIVFDCKTCANLTFSGGKISACACREGRFEYSKYPPEEVPDSCGGGWYIPKTINNLPTGH